MIAALKRAYGRFRGFDLTGSTVPPMEGPLKPNALLDAALVAITLPDIDNLTATSLAIMCSSGKELLTLEMRSDPKSKDAGFAIAARETFRANISCLASDGEGGLAIGLDGCGVSFKGGRHDGHMIVDLAGMSLRCPTAVSFVAPDTVVIANGSAETQVADWKRDLMNLGSSGSLWRVDLAPSDSKSTSIRLADKLAFPCGIAAFGEKDLVVSEAWRHRMISASFDGSTAPKAILDELPAYPGRIIPAMGGGYWLALFAPRNPLVEFVLLEYTYRRRMMERIDSEFWIAPSLANGRSFLEPIQGGARKKLNMLKPWSPSWSCGLVVKCDKEFRPITSFHSRADGGVHGITSLCEYSGRLFAGAKGSGLVVSLDPGQAMPKGAA